MQAPTNDELYNSKGKLGQIKKMSLWFDDRFEEVLDKGWGMRTGETLSEALRHEPKLGCLELLCVSISALMNPAEGYDVLFSRMIADDVGGPEPYMSRLDLCCKPLVRK